MKQSLTIMYALLVVSVVACERANPRLDSCLIRADVEYEECMDEASMNTDISDIMSGNYAEIQMRRYDNCSREYEMSQELCETKFGR